MKLPWTKPADDHSDATRSARNTLRSLSASGVRVPEAVAAPILSANQVPNLDDMDPDLEDKLLKATAILNGVIKPHELARRHYRLTFYVVLALVLIFQLYQTAVTTIQARLLHIADAPQTTPVTVAVNATPVALDSTVRDTYVHAADFVVSIPRNLLYRLPFTETLFPFERKPGDHTDLIIGVELDLAALFLGTYLLPLLYGMLGAVAYVLRRIDQYDPSRRVALDQRNPFALRIPIGALSGLAVGWLVQPSAGNALTSLSPVALAFVAGYSSELVFTFMDRLVSAFSQASPAPSSPSPTDTQTQVPQRTISTDDDTAPAPTKTLTESIALGEDPKQSAAGDGEPEALVDAKTKLAPASRAQANADSPAVRGNA